MKKIFLSGLMVLMMLCALFPTVIFAEETDFGVGDTGTAEIAPSLGGKCLQVTEQHGGKQYISCRHSGKCTGSICNGKQTLC